MEKLQFISEQMTALEVPYSYGKWNDKVTYPYFVGEITEEEPTTEDGKEQATLLITGFHRGKYIDFETIKAKIKKHFDPIHGLRASIDGGSIVVFYCGAIPVPTNEADLKKIQINLKIKFWRGA